MKKIGVLAIPILFGVYPVLALFAFNTGDVDFNQTTRALLLALVFALALTGLCLLALRNLHKASLLASGWLIVFYAYGQVYDLVRAYLGAQVGRHVFLLPLALLALLAWAVWLWRTSARLDSLLSFSGLMITALLIMVSYSLAKYYLPLWASDSQRAAQAAASAQTGKKPDIYYIILDGHGRQDMLQQIYNYDNSDFINALKQKGFFVADSGHSNYMQTVLSLSSSLNMQYIDTMDLPTVDPHDGLLWLEVKIRHSLVRDLLTNKGYQMVTFANGFPTVPTDADIYYDFDTTPQAAAIYSGQGPYEFEQILLSSTILRVALDQGWIPTAIQAQQHLGAQRQFLHQYEQTRYILDQLAQIPKLPGDHFVFAHILAPHPPFVVGRDGEFAPGQRSYSFKDGSQFPGTREEYIAGYHNKAAYIDAAILSLVTKLLADSDPQPIIIIQGDHGPGAYLDWTSAARTNVDERLSIFNAYYFPDGHTAKLYPSITPVNSFRVLFDEYFGDTYPLLDDRSYYSTWAEPLRFVDVTDRLTARH